MKGMVYSIICLILLNGWGGLSAQKAILEEFDFSQGDFTILVFQSPWLEDDFRELVDSGAVHVYFDQPASLERIKDALVLNPITDAPEYSASHIMEVCRNGKSEMHIEWEDYFNHYLHSPAGDFRFSGHFDFAGYKLARLQRFEFQDIATARRSMDSLRTLPGLILMREPRWKTYMGEFLFHVDLPLMDEDTALAKLSAEISAQYPGEPFELTIDYISKLGDKFENTYYVGVKCNFSLYERFALFPRTKDPWMEYWLHLDTFWKR
jgi:hypothetical protein